MHSKFGIFEFLGLLWARFLRKMLDEPLQNSKLINERLDGVDELVKKLIVRDKLSEILGNINDIERLSGKIAYGTIQPGDLLSLKKSLAQIPEVKKVISSSQSSLLKKKILKEAWNAKLKSFNILRGCTGFDWQASQM